jgi:hypothetical protein
VRPPGVGAQQPGGEGIDVAIEDDRVGIQAFAILVRRRARRRFQRGSARSVSHSGWRPAISRQCLERVANAAMPPVDSPDAVHLDLRNQHQRCREATQGDAPQ